MTVKQQHEHNQRLATQRKFKEIKTIADGRGAPLKCEKFPELTVLLENIFADNGLESHPRLIDDVLYRATNNALTMKKAREVLLSLAPENFKICLSTCFNYTQNFKAGTAQAKRHHEGKNINSCISLHAPPRIGTEKSSPNLHWTSSNVKLMLSTDDKNTIFDSKDAKAIVCADISPVQRPSKTWKKKEGVLLDHEWNQSRTNAVTPMAHLFLDESKNKDANSLLRSGKAAVLVNLSYYEPSTTFRCFNELFKLLLNPGLSGSFLNNGDLRKSLVNIVDNGPGEAPSSPLVQMLLIRTRKFLKMESVCQISFSEYHSKRNFVERVHSQENLVLSRHGKFSSTMVHEKNKAGSKEHRENMEAMAHKVIDCISDANFGGSPVTCQRGIKDDEKLFNDEEELKAFLSLSESKKETFQRNYKPTKGKLLNELCTTFNLDTDFESNYYDDYKELMTSWKDKYTFFSNSNQNQHPKQPIPDYIGWVRVNGELHYLSKDQISCLGTGTWESVPGLFMPTNILQMVFDTLVVPLNSVSRETLLAISFLAWLPINEVERYFEEETLARKEDFQNSVLREALHKLPFYAQKKEVLQKLAKEKGLDQSGTKLEIAQRIVKADKIKVQTKPLYNGRKRSIPLFSSKVRKLGIASLKAILFHHNQPTSGTKDELVLNVCLLRANREHCIGKNKAIALLGLIKTAEILICRQLRSNGTNEPSRKRRRFETPNEASLSSKKPRRNASQAVTYVKSRIDVPVDINVNNIGNIFDPLKSDLIACSRPSDSDTLDVVEEEDSEAMEENAYDMFFEIGVKVEVRRSKSETKSGKRGGWFVAVVQDFDHENDWIKVEFSSEEEIIHKINVTELINGDKLRLKNSLF
ncbi:uncharacterized protein [Clytia hemisphaerica]